MARNEPWSAITHLIASVFAITAMILLIVVSNLQGDPWKIVSLTIYGASMTLLYLTSTLYHFFYRDRKKVKEIFKRIDHSMIYFLIAGTYTPVCLTILRGTLGWTMFGIIWALAAAGISLKSSGVRISAMVSTAFYVAMGWLIVIGIVPLAQSLSILALTLLFAGGIFYTTGAVLYFIGEKKGTIELFSWHEYFHLLTILGSASHFIFMWYYIL